LRVLEQAVSDLGVLVRSRPRCKQASIFRNRTRSHRARGTWISSDQTLELLKAILVVDPGAEVIVASRDTSRSCHGGHL